MRYPFVYLAVAVGVALHLSSALAGATNNCSEIRVGGVTVCTGSETGIAEDAEIEGVTVINGKVFIDGVPVRQGVSRVTSKKSGKTYLIKTDKKGNVSVDEQ